jgi:hypothetical protein
MIETMNNLDSYILNENNMLSYLKYKLSNSSIKNKQIETIQKEKMIKHNIRKPSFFIPKENDTLFWCYYIILNGEVNYEMLNNRNILVEKQNKIIYVNKIRGNKQTVKTYKFDTLTNIESNLANDNFISIKTVMSLCAIDKINIIFINKKTYFEFLMNDDKPVYIIRVVESMYNKKYGFEVSDTTMLEEIRKSLYKVDVLDKPIKALSSYKVQELIDICNKLAIEIVNKETGKNKTKNELYESIIQYF